MGYTITLTASLVHQVMLNFKKPALEKGVKAGIAAMRALYQCGYKYEVANHPDPVFPIDELADYLEKLENSAFTVDNAVSEITVSLPRPDRSDSWSILEMVSQVKKIEDMAREIVTLGIEGAEKHLVSIPILQIGDLVAVERREIEAYRGIQATIAEYIKHIAEHSRNREKKPKPRLTPLNIAVFGPPGSGKSFAIREVAQHIKQITEEIAKREFNLSQFEDPKALHGALHQVRDLRLSGKLRMVVWDEFDTKLGDQPLGWLRYFLAPMHDGTFEQGEVTHSIGPCIFVFAGGTFESRAAFELQADEGKGKTAKVPDFISRLHGYLDVLGPNPQDKIPSSPISCTLLLPYDRLEDQVEDRFFLIRRAFLLRSLFDTYAPQLFEGTDKSKKELQIERGVLHALLCTKNYVHGTRSMQALITMSALARKRRFDPSSLPSESVLKLHVDAEDFQECLKKGNG